MDESTGRTRKSDVEKGGFILGLGYVWREERRQIKELDRF